jgi:hypothetical protein
VPAQCLRRGSSNASDPLQAPAMTQANGRSGRMPRSAFEPDCAH